MSVQVITASPIPSSDDQFPTEAATSTPTPTPYPFTFPDFPEELLIEILPVECPGIGSQAYYDPTPYLATSSQAVDFPVVLTRGELIVVTTSSDEVNADLSSLVALLENPGADGISLREALMLANNAPGEYTIQFDPDLAGAVIQVGSWEPRELPPLESGSVVITGDIDGDQQPDITLENHINAPNEENSAFGLRIHSSHNTLFGLGFSGFAVGVFFDAPSTDQIYTDNTLSHLFIEGESGIVLYSGEGSDDVPIIASNNRWENTRLTGNTIIAHNGSGISFSMHRASMDHVAYLTIVNNHIQVVNEGTTSRGNGIDVSPGFGSGSDGNTAKSILIQGNVIEGNPTSAIGLASGFMGAEGNVVKDVHILENTVRITYTYTEYIHTSGIHVSAGFWVNQVGNEISDIVVAGNTLEGNPEISVLISSGAVGSSKNLVERIFFHNNRIRVTQPAREDGIPISAIGITTGDGASDYYDPNYAPIVYPNDNILRDVWISGNVIEGQGGYGIMLSTGDPGVERNNVERIYIIGNEFQPFFPEMGILVNAISLEHGGSGDNHISEVFIQQNTIRYTNLRGEFGGEEFVSGGIILSAGNGASRNYTEDIWVVANEISSPAPGINLVAGWAQPQFPPSVGNTIRNVRLWCNDVAEQPDLLEPLFPGIKGINLAGGWGKSKDNKVTDITTFGNRVAGIDDDVSVFDNAGSGSEGNLVNYP